MIKQKWLGRATAQHIFYWLNILVSLFLGLAIYVFFRPDAYVSQALYNVMGVSVDGIITKDALPTWLLLFIRNFLGDISWAYALTFTICYIWLTPGGRMIPVFGIVTIFEIGIEVLQKVCIIPGTFDWWDIFLEICITAFVMLLIKNLGKETNQ